jgi:hypothetical protein
MHFETSVMFYKWRIKAYLRLTQLKRAYLTHLVMYH